MHTAIAIAEQIVYWTGFVYFFRKTYKAALNGAEKRRIKERQIATSKAVSTSDYLSIVAGIKTKAQAMEMPEGLTGADHFWCFVIGFALNLFWPILWPIGLFIRLLTKGIKTDGMKRKEDEAQQAKRDALQLEIDAQERQIKRWAEDHPDGTLPKLTGEMENYTLESQLFGEAKFGPDASLTTPDGRLITHAYTSGYCEFCQGKCIHLTGKYDKFPFPNDTNNATYAEYRRRKR